MTLILDLGRYKRYGFVGVQKAAPAPAEKIEALAKSLEPDIAAAILKALNDQKEGVSLDAIAEALEQGNVQKVLDLLSIDEFKVAAGDFGHSLANAAWKGGALAATQIGEMQAIKEVRFGFEQLNPTLVNWLQTYQLGLIRQINDGTREGIRQALADNMIKGANPRDAARDVRQVIGLTNKQAQAVLNFRKELEGFHQGAPSGYNLGAKIDRVNGAQVFKPDAEGLPKDGITERRLRDFRYDGQLKRAAETGKPLTQAQIDKMVDAYARKYLKYRSETIAISEATRATSVGVQDAWRQAIESGKVNEDLVRRSWLLADDERTCEICAAVPGMNPPRGVKFGEPFKTPIGPVMYGPLHPRCRCTVWIQQFEPSQLQD